VWEVLDRRVGTWEEEAFVTVVRPPNEERRAAVFAPDLQDLGVPIRFAHVMALDHQSISDVRLHDVLLVARNRTEPIQHPPGA